MSEESGNAPLSPVSEAARKKHFREMAYRDALEEASQEERDLLRRDENLGHWREALVSLLADLQREFRDRKKQYNRVKNRANKEKTYDARAALQKESEEYESWKLTGSTYKVDLDEKLSENKAAPKSGIIGGTRAAIPGSCCGAAAISSAYAGTPARSPTTKTSF